MVIALVAAFLAATPTAGHYAGSSSTCCAISYHLEVQPQEPVGIPPFPIAYGLSVLTLAPEQSETANTLLVRATIGQYSDDIVYDAEGRESGFGPPSEMPLARFRYPSPQASENGAATSVFIGDRQLIMNSTILEDRAAHELSISGQVHPIDTSINRVEFVEKERDGVVVEAAFHEFRGGAERMRLYLSLESPTRAADFAFPTLYLSCFATRELISPRPPATSCFP